MEAKLLSRSHLETLSNADLIALADGYGIDIPDDLNRRFIIGELLEMAEEIARDSPAEREADMEEDDSVPGALDELPASFNETQVGVVFQNPVWAFVYWDIKESDVKRLAESGKFRHLALRVSYFLDEDSAAPEESFDIQLAPGDRAQYVMLSAGKRFVRIDLVACFETGAGENLAISRKIALPQGSPLLGDALPGRDRVFPPILEASGIRAILREHYEKHRELFSH